MKKIRSMTSCRCVDVWWANMWKSHLHHAVSWSLSRFTVTVPNQRFMSRSWSFLRLDLELNQVNSVLSGFNCSILDEHQTLTWSTQSSIRWQIACASVSDSRHDSRYKKSRWWYLVYIKNSSRPRTDPWGKLHESATIDGLKCLCMYGVMTTSSALSCTPKQFCNMLMRTWSVVSNAALIKYYNTTFKYYNICMP